MNAKIEKLKVVPINPQVTEEDAQAAVRTLLRYIGEDPSREGLKDTPKRVVKSFAEFYGGYAHDPAAILSKTFTDVENYQDIILLENIRLRSTCEHHMLPISGYVHIGYIPNKKVVGISKLARVVEVLAKRLQIQEKLTVQIAEAINSALAPQGVGVIVSAKHQCMTDRGVCKEDSLMTTSHFIGSFATDNLLKTRFLSGIKKY
ncbi:MAG: GTP cyclohydrolase I FolE [Rickettsiales bacterium]